ncbi:MAG: hypothetical protein Q7R81_07225 [Candidatus Peregrinibacteria bacterium]|nr:hypothetical protein [Candidatus Peregrinibacteria bacterium]
MPINSEGLRTGLTEILMGTPLQRVADQEYPTDASGHVTQEALERMREKLQHAIGANDRWLAANVQHAARTKVSDYSEKYWSALASIQPDASE